MTVSNQINLQINSPICKLVNIHFNAVKLAHHQYFQCLKSGYIRFKIEQWSCNIIKIKAIVDMNYWMFAATLSEVYRSLNSEKPYLINNLGCET